VTILRRDTSPHSKYPSYEKPYKIKGGKIPRSDFREKERHRRQTENPGGKAGEKKQSKTDKRSEREIESIESVPNHRGSIQPKPQVYSMKIISWNVRGYNNTLKSRILKMKIVGEKPLVLMLQETKCSEDSLKDLGARIWRGCKTIGINTNRPYGGIGIMWNP